MFDSWTRFTRRLLVTGRSIVSRQGLWKSLCPWVAQSQTIFIGSDAKLSIHFSLRKVSLALSPWLGRKSNSSVEPSNVIETTRHRSTCPTYTSRLLTSESRSMKLERQQKRTKSFSNFKRCLTIQLWPRQQSLGRWNKVLDTEKQYFEAPPRGQAQSAFSLAFQRIGHGSSLVREVYHAARSTRYGSPHGSMITVLPFCCHWLWNRTDNW